MTINRKAEEFETDNKEWKIYFDLELDKTRERGENVLDIRLANNLKRYSLTEEDFSHLKQDLKDLGKWRKFKELKRDLEK